MANAQLCYNSEDDDDGNGDIKPFTANPVKPLHFAILV